MSIEKDDPSGFVGNIESDLYIAQIIVSEGEYKPCRYVEMTILDTSKGADQKPVFWYGDKEGKWFRIL